ncbi:MAG: metal-dependent hydrolase [Pyrinomonadaceae bacterium]|nr:metal-dependent hydrolase [Pyrinomonadaceae bacterium]
MDNLTHSLVGLVASKAGLERLSPGATVLCILAANAPDSDIVTLIGGRWSFLHYHRGITHSILGSIILALTLPLIFYLGDCLIARIRARQPAVKLKGLLIASVLVTATHPLMDWTNNYGLRPFLPWSSQWYYGDFVFIIDPFLWMILGGACFLLTSKSKLQLGIWLLLALLLTYLVITVPGRQGLDQPTVLRAIWILVLIGLMVSFKLGAAQRWGSRIALAALVLVAVYWGSLASLHWFAMNEATIEARAIVNQHGESITDIAAMPTLANPFRWSCVVETENAAYRFELSLAGNHSGLSQLIRHERADTSDSPPVEQALLDERARIFLDFARFPVARVVGADCMTQTLVQLADLRYTQPGSARGTFSLDVPVNCPTQETGQASRPQLDERNQTNRGL